MNIVNSIINEAKKIKASNAVCFNLDIILILIVFSN